MQRIMRTVLYGLRTFVIFLGLSFFLPTFAADVTSTDPVYCHQNECLYCNEAGCVITPTNADKSMDLNNGNVDDLDELSSAQLDQMLSDLMDETPSPEINDKIATINGTLHKQMEELTPKARKVSREYASKINKDAHTTYNTLKGKNQQMLRERAKKQPVRHQPSKPYTTTNKPIRKTSTRKPTPKIVASNQQVKKTSPLNKSANKLPPISKPITIIPIFHYKPSIDFAQYALHQGNVRSANLVEGFIPLGKWAFDNVLFTDLRYYNPNGTPIEWNADIGFRGLPRGDLLWGLYGGFDRFRSSTSRYFSQVNAGFEFWFNKVFLGANAYVPVGTKEYDNIDDGAHLVSTSDSWRYNIAYEDEHDERILPGGDAELGYDITHGLTVYGGGYYFHHSGFSTVAGPKLRATYTLYRSHAHRLLGLFDRIRFEGLVTHDKPRGTNWLFGIRFTLGLAKQPNPTFSVIRHMADPLRRDINGVSEAFNTEDLLRDSSGNIVNVDIPDNGANLTINQAVDDDTAEIVGVVDEQTPSSTLDVGGHELTITGQQYNFTRGNHTYTVQIGNNGDITGAFDPVINMMGASNVTIEHLSIDSSNNPAISIEDPTTTLGLLTINDVTSNAGPFNVTLTSAGGEATIAFDYNNFETSSGSSYDHAVFFNLSNATQLTVTSFTHNSITTNDKDSTGVLNTVRNGTIDYTGNFNFNEIETNTTEDSNDSAPGESSSGVYNYTNGENGDSYIFFDGDVSNNHVTVHSNQSRAFETNTENSQNSTNDSEITYRSKFDSNRFTTTAGETTSAFYNDAKDNSTINFNGAISNNVARTENTNDAESNAIEFFVHSINNIGTGPGGTINITVGLFDNIALIASTPTSSYGFSAHTTTTLNTQYGTIAITGATSKANLSSQNIFSTTNIQDAVGGYITTCNGLDCVPPTTFNKLFDGK